MQKQVASRFAEVGVGDEKVMSVVGAGVVCVGGGGGGGGEDVVDAGTNTKHWNR